jgi:hypothetical protein
MRRRLARRAPWLPFAALGAGACAGHAEEGPLAVASQREAVVYGTDDRQEPFEITDAPLRALAEGTAVALVARDSVRATAAGVELDAPRLGDAYGLCAGERFLDQPAPALCTGVLVSPRLVLTAGHCARQLPCEAMALVRGYRFESEGRLAPLGPGDVSHCAEILAIERSAPDASERIDYAWIALESPLGGGLEITLREPTEPLEVGEAVATFGFGQGVPLKIDTGGSVSAPRLETLDYFVTTSDTFHGGSGAGIFDGDLRLVGVLARGADDYVVTPEGCAAVAELPDDRSAASEQATYAFHAFDALERACDGARAPEACATELPDTAPRETGCGVSTTGSRGWSGGALVIVALGVARRRRPRQQPTGTPC